MNGRSVGWLSYGLVDVCVCVCVSLCRCVHFNQYTTTHLEFIEQKLVTVPGFLTSQMQTNWLCLSLSLSLLHSSFSLFYFSFFILVFLQHSHCQRHSITDPHTHKHTCLWWLVKSMTNFIIIFGEMKIATCDTSAQMSACARVYIYIYVYTKFKN